MKKRKEDGFYSGFRYDELGVGNLDDLWAKAFALLD